MHAQTQNFVDTTRYPTSANNPHHTLLYPTLKQILLLTARFWFSIFPALVFYFPRFYKLL